MANLIIPKPWKRQPQGTLRANPRWGDIRLLMTGRFAANMASGSAVTYGADGVTPYGTSYGVGLDLSGSGTGGVLCNTGPDTNVATFVFICSVEGVGGGGVGRIMSQYNGAATGKYDFYISDNSIYFQIFATGGNWLRRCDLGSYGPNIYSHCVTVDISSSSADPIWYLDGRKQSLFNHGNWSGSLYAAQPITAVGRRQDVTTRQLDGKIIMAAYLANIVDDGGAKELSQNPWQLFLPSTSRVYFLGPFLPSAPIFGQASL